MASVIQFTKMHGLGNDFMVINTQDQSLQLTPQLIQQWADRHLGVGFDQLLLLSPTQDADIPWHYQIYNADGHEVEQCGNGARCVAHYLHENGLAPRDMTLAMKRGPLQAKVLSSGLVQVNMGIPVLEPKHIPFISKARALSYDLTIAEDDYQIGVVSMGNPHCVVQVPSLVEAPVAALGKRISCHESFPTGVNVGFMQVVSRTGIQLRVFERGVGETQACGSGACAAVVIGRLWQLLDEQVDVELQGGCLQIAWQGEGKPVWMTGPSCAVYEGKIELY